MILIIFMPFILYKLVYGVVREWQRRKKTWTLRSLRGTAATGVTEIKTSPATVHHFIVLSKKNLILTVDVFTMRHAFREECLGQ